MNLFTHILESHTMPPTLGTILGQKSAQQTCDSGTCPLALIVYNNH
ncbi:rCG37198, partial [Rattus norvegicus]